MRPTAFLSPTSLTLAFRIETQWPQSIPRQQIQGNSPALSTVRERLRLEVNANIVCKATCFMPTAMFFVQHCQSHHCLVGQIFINFAEHMLADIRLDLSAGNGALTSFVGVGPATPPTQGGWTLLTPDTGNTMIHAIPLSNGQILIMERPGNRESPVSSHTL